MLVGHRWMCSNRPRLGPRGSDSHLRGIQIICWSALEIQFSFLVLLCACLTDSGSPDVIQRCLTALMGPAVQYLASKASAAAALLAEKMAMT